MTEDQKKLNNLIERRHPRYKDQKSHWDFLASCYEGGRGWFNDNIFKYIKEGDIEYADRLERAYRFNHSREVVDLVSKYIFKSKISRKEDASDAVKEFWKSSTLGGLGIQQYSRQLSDKSSIYGRIWVVVDSSRKGSALNLAEEKESGGRIYSYIVAPQNALDMAFDETGELLWILIHEQIRDDKDPIDSTGEMQSQYRLWTRDAWFLFTTTGSGKDIQISFTTGDHELGVVPVFPVDHITTDESPYLAPSLIGDIAYLDRAVANYLSNLDAIIQDQTFSQLTIPAQGLTAGEKGYDKMVEMGTKRIFTYDGEGGSKPEYISPDPKQAEIIVMVIKQIINEIYHTVGMAGERTKQDNSVGIDNSSGVAKAYDFERVNALLTSKAGMLQQAENKLVDLVNKWANQSNGIEEALVEYPETFDTRSLYDEFEIGTRLALVSAPDSVRRQQMEQVINKLFPELKRDLKAKMMSELKKWPEHEEMVIPGKSALDKTADEPNDNAQDTEQR